MITEASLSALSAPDNQLIASLIDLTCLDLDATSTVIKNLAQKAVDKKVAAVCVYPEHLHWIDATLPIRRATVVNFPAGALIDITEALHAIKETESIDEIDYVFPYRAYLSGQKSNALLHCNRAYSAAHALKLTFKVILETGAFPDLKTLYTAAMDVLGQGVDFLKTSTGKIPQGATVNAVHTLLSAIQATGNPCGIKISGGVRDVATAITYIKLASSILKKNPDSSWLRLGASQLLDHLN